MAETRVNHPPAWETVDAKASAYFELSDRVWDTPETNFEEFRSSTEHARQLQAEGFKVTRGVGGLPTAVMGEAGEGGPVIAILGEFDALPGLSQQAGVAEPRPLKPDGAGHGCGHHLLGAGAMLAAAAVKDELARRGLKGRVRYYGCPAEEGGSGKGFMVRAGAFDDVDIFFCWHPAAFAGVNLPVSLACAEMNFHFTGKASHASTSPHLGRSALDAVELMNVGVNYMREHMPSTARIHYAITDSGGAAPNVVQAKATVRYLVRARTLPEMNVLTARVGKIAEGASLMTETSVRCEMISGDANLIGNGPLERLMQVELDRLGPPVFDDDDRAAAKRFQSTFTEDDIRDSFVRFGLKPRENVSLCDCTFDMNACDPGLVGSTDVGTVSWIAPTVQMRGATYAVGTPGHSWQLVAQGKLPAAHKGMAHVAKVIASSALELYENPALIKAAKDDHRERLTGMTFINPIPDDVQPELPQGGGGA